MIKGIVSTYDNLSQLPILKKAPPNPNTKAANVNFDRSKKYFAIFSLRIFTNSRASLFFSLLLSKSLMTKIQFISGKINQKRRNDDFGTVVQ